MEWFIIDPEGDQVLASTPSAKGWANVFVGEDEDYQRLGYSVLEKRWAYGEEPVEARMISRAIA